MNGPKNDTLHEKAEELRRRLEYSPEPSSGERDLRDPPLPTNLPKEKKASAFCRELLALIKEGAELTPEARSKLPKKDFAVSASKSNTGEKAYPIPDEQHARSALGFARMHGDAADYARVRAKVEKKYPGLIQKKAAALPPAPGLFQRLGRGLASEAGTHKAELAGLGILAVPGLDQLQAHGRAAIAGDYNKDGVKKREVLPHVTHPLMETAGLGVLAAPSIAHLRKR